jgi:DNA-binding FrmR family transcriptional regulator
MENTVHEQNREDILLRLRKIEGQIRGIQKMIARDAECGEILVQVAAAKSAMKRVGTLVIQNYLKKCVDSALDREGSEERERSIGEWIDIVSRYLE